MEKNQQVPPQQAALRQEPSDVTGSPAYRPVNEGDATYGSDAGGETGKTERHAESSQPQNENETLGTP